MASVEVTIDGTTLTAIEAHVAVSRARTEKQGLRVADSMSATAFFYADIRNKAQNPQDAVIDLFKMVTEDLVDC